MPEGASSQPEKDKAPAPALPGLASLGGSPSPQASGSPDQLRARNVEQSDAIVRTHEAEQSSGGPPRGRIVGLSDLPSAPAPAEDASIEQLVTQIAALIEAGKASIKIPGPGRSVDGKVTVPAAPNPAFASPEVHDKLVELVYKLTNEHRGPTEPWPVGDFHSKDIPELIDLANQLLAARNAKLAPPPASSPSAPAQRFPGEGHALGGKLSLEESRAHLPGPERPAPDKAASAPGHKAPVKLLPQVQPPQPAKQAQQPSTGNASDRPASGAEHGMRDRPSGASTITSVIEPPKGPHPTALLPQQEAPSNGSPGKAEVVSPGKAEVGPKELPKAPPPAPSPAAQQAAREAYRRHIAQGGGWASEAELTELANAAGVTVMIHHFDDSGHETHIVPIGSGAQVVHLRHMGNHYDVIESGGIVKIAGDGHCGFVAFYRAVTGMLPTPDEIADLRRHAASHLPDEHVDNILAAQDVHDVDMHRMDGPPGSHDSLELDADEILDILGFLLDEEQEQEQEEDADKHEAPAPQDPSAAPKDDAPAPKDDDAEANLVKEAIEDGASEDLRLHDAEIDSEVEEALAKDDPKAKSEDEDEEAEEDEAPGPKDPGGPPDDGPPDGGPPGGGPGRGGPGKPGHDAQPPAPVIRPDYKPTDPGLQQAVLTEVDKGTAATRVVGSSGSNHYGAQDKAFGGVVAPLESQQGHAIDSGVSDVVASMGGTVGIALKLEKLKEHIATLSSKEKGAAAKGEAAAEIGKIVTGLTQQYCVLESGILTLVQSGGQSPPSSSFGFTATGASMTTDWKMAGDAAGLLGDLIGVVGLACEAIKNHEKVLKGTAAEATGRVGMLVAKSLATLGTTARSLGQLVGQIEGHGKMVTGFGGPAFTAFSKNVPLVGAGVAAMNIGRQSYNVHKFRKRRARLKQMLQAERLSGNQQAAVQFIREVLKKRITRAGIDIGLSSVDLVSGVLQAATPVGFATGIAINAATTSVRLGMVGTRVIKQKLRDRTAEKRKNAKDPSESYEAWSARQKAKGMKGKLNAAFTMNWDKSSAKKREAYIRHAMTIVEMDNDTIYGSIGLSKAKLAKMENAKKRVEAIIEALQKR